MSRSFDCADPDARTEGIAAATAAVGEGNLVVLPTDTVYGLGADAFSHDAVARLLLAKGRGRDMPVPVLIGSMRTLDGIATHIPDVARDLVAAFWPGALTVICLQQPSLMWDLGDARGTVAVRMPLHEVALDLLRATGPLAVSSANISRHDPATTVAEAEAQLGDWVEVYLDAGPTTDSVPSTIIDVTGERVRVLRLGAVSAEDLRSVAPDLDVLE
ncbi:MAG TPA: L-threonylcarbamoyladenylate synthase [Sporichthyaceae bacterium]|jgi:tRNA threonylcarbamoyl adenosine modification protein (Sua5/YciO/YrdC/YwlC family)